MNVHILEMPLDFGASRHGSDMGPSAIRLAGIKERLESLGHKTYVHSDIFQPSAQEYEDVGNPKAKYLHPIINACTKLAEKVEEITAKDEFPFVLGGDHSIVLGSLAGLAATEKSAFCMLMHMEISIQPKQPPRETFMENALRLLQESDSRNSQTFTTKDRKSIQRTYVLWDAETLIRAKNCL